MCAASLENLIANDPFDQKLKAALEPTVAPLLDFIARSPAMSQAIVEFLAQNKIKVGCSIRCAAPLHAI